MAVIAVLDPLLCRPGTLAADPFPGHDVVRLGDATPGEVGRALRRATVILTAMAPVGASTLESAPGLRLVAKPGAGLDNIDVAAATRHGVVVCHAPGTRGQAVAEYVLWAVLDLAKRTGRAPLPLDVGGTTIGLVGLGDIGARVAVAAHALQMQVVAATPSRRNPVPDVPVHFVDLADIHRDVEALVLCMPLRPETEGLVDRQVLEQMRRDAVVINVARGRCVVTEDLVRVLTRGHLRGAALDVTHPEPLPADHPLRRLRNVILTDHIAGRTPRAQRRAIGSLLDDVHAFLRGERPRHAVNWDAVEVGR